MCASALTGDERESFHGRKRICSGSVEYVQSIDLTADLVDLAVEILDGRRVAIVEGVVKETRNDGGLPHPGRPKQDETEAVLCRDVSLLSQQDRHRSSSRKRTTGRRRGPRAVCPGGAIGPRGTVCPPRWAVGPRRVAEGRR